MSPHGRRKSVDSSSSSSSDSDSGSDYKHGKVKKEKKSKDKKSKDSKKKGDKHLGGHNESPFGSGAPSMPQAPLMPDLNAPGHRVMPAIPPAFHNATSSPANAPPASGYRIPLHPTAVFPEQSVAGVPPCHDVDGSPVFFGSALLDKSVQPCKVVPRLANPCSVAFGGREMSHNGRYDLLPFDPATMELVPASKGQVPVGRRLVEGGYEENGNALFHGVASVRGTRVPGKVGTHLGGCNVSFGGGEHIVRDHYEVLYVASSL
ncbi:hypothetical protein CPB85DRAFT_1274436 [Mucidula mucida]|nr:hypothetical protein CPB85DRAFT_1274436 [Mucidula mucida]